MAAPSDSTIVIYDLTEKYGSVKSLLSSLSHQHEQPQCTLGMIITRILFTIGLQLQSRKSLHSDNLFIQISPVLSARNLGAYFDSNMTLVPFINNTCKSAFSQLYNIRRIRKYLTTDISNTLVHAMITSRIDYCNSLLCGLQDNSLNKLQRVQNAAARLITGTAKFSHISPVLRTLHWLTITQRVQFYFSKLLMA